MHIDFNKYKRVFAFGCSFTNYIYPTWADLIMHEMPSAECYNFGKAGGGQNHEGRGRHQRQHNPGQTKGKGDKAKADPEQTHGFGCFTDPRHCRGRGGV